MSTFVEFTAAHGAFPLDDVFESFPDATVELERSVPMDSAVIPFVRVTGADADEVATALSDDPAVAEASIVERRDREMLFRIDWQSDPDGIVAGMIETSATVLEVRGDHRWVFRLRFPDQDALAAFSEHCADCGVAIDIESVRRSSAAGTRGSRFGLTTEQREALVLALRRGYFETPSRTTLNDLAEVIGISQQAISQRIRRGTKRVLRVALLDGTSTPAPY